MSKKVALLVTSTFKTRVVVDVPDDWDENTTDELWYNEKIISNDIANDIANKAANHYKNCIACGIYDNIEEVVNDKDIPFGNGYKDNEE